MSIGRVILSLDPHFHLEHTLLRVSRQVQQHAVSILIFSVLAVTLFLTISRFLPKEGIPESPKALQALLTIMTPTCMAWPTDYAAVLNHLSCTRSKTIRIQLSDFLHHVGTGTVEFRSFDDFSHLLRCQLRAYGWLVCLEVDISLRSSVLRWILLSQIPGFTQRYATSLCDRMFIYHRCRINVEGNWDLPSRLID